MASLVFVGVLLGVWLLSHLWQYREDRSTFRASVATLIDEVERYLSVRGTGGRTTSFYKGLSGSHTDGTAHEKLVEARDRLEAHEEQPTGEDDRLLTEVRRLLHALEDAKRRDEAEAAAEPARREEEERQRIERRKEREREEQERRDREWAIVKNWQNIQQLRDYLRISTKALRDLTPREFEARVAKAFKAAGFKVKLTPLSNDEGRDLIIERAGRRYFVECKKYMTSTVGRPDLQKILGAAVGEGADGAIMVTTGHLTAATTKFAKTAGVEVISGSDLEGLMSTLHDRPAQQPVMRLRCPNCPKRVKFRLHEGPFEARMCSCGEEVPHPLGTDPRNKSLLKEWQQIAEGGLEGYTLY